MLDFLNESKHNPKEFTNKIPEFTSNFLIYYLSKFELWYIKPFKLIPIVTPKHPVLQKNLLKNIII